jgi:hypothetical protein
MFSSSGVSPPPHLRMETDQIFEILCFLEYKTMQKVVKSSNSEAKIACSNSNVCRWLTFCSE